MVLHLDSLWHRGTRELGNGLLANSSWCVWTAQKQSAITLANCWRHIELVSTLANFFTNFFRVGKLVSDAWTIDKHVLLTVNQSNYALYSHARDLFEWRGRKSRWMWRWMWSWMWSLKFIEVVHNCPAVWKVLSVVYKDIKNKQTKKWSSYGTNWVSSKPFYFATAFYFFSFRFLTVLLLYVSATALSQPYCKLPCTVIWPGLVWPVWRNEIANSFKFANLRLPCEGQLRGTIQYSNLLTLP